MGAVGSALSSGFQKVKTGVGQFASGVLPHLGNTVLGGLKGFASGGPLGAAMGAINGVMPGLQAGLSNVIAGAYNPAGPTSLQEAMSEYGPKALNLARDAVNSDMFKTGMNQGREVFGNFVNNVRGGQNWRAAFANAGGEPFLAAQGQNFANFISNRMQGSTGISGTSAVVNGNPYARTAAANSGMNSVHRETNINAIRNTSTSLATQAASANLANS